MENLIIKVIIGSTREGRFSEKSARWIHDELAKETGVDVELLDLRDYPLPFFNQLKSPSRVPEGYDIDVPAYRQWRAKIMEADAYVFVTPEYNHGYSAVLKNALDWLYAEWNKKAVGFVAHGNAGGARAVEQLRQVAIELELASVRRALHLSGDIYKSVAAKEATVDPALFAPVEEFKKQFIEQLLWWGRALKEARGK